MTPEENALLAKLDGWDLDTAPWKISKDGCFADPPDYDDERNLMPLAWNMKLACVPDDDVWQVGLMSNFITYENKDPKQAIQQALLSIAREKFSE